MATPSHESPWRHLFEEVRRELHGRRDENGVLGSINWLRKAMAARGANPNVVRNIIYRDKGKLADKRALFELLKGLWEGLGRGPLRAPELEALLSMGDHAEEAAGLPGREKRRVYGEFVSGVRGGSFPKRIVTGRPGSGKTLLLDAVQGALNGPLKAAPRVVRFEFTGDLAASLGRLTQALGIPAQRFESRLAKISRGAYAVQADAQAGVARVFVDALKHDATPTVLLLYASGALAARESLGAGLAAAPLRLNTPDVPRVNGSEWLWVLLLAPLSALPHLSLLVSTPDLPVRALPHLVAFGEPVKLSPPTLNEARRFVKGRLPELPPAAQEALVARAGRSFEELRTLTLLTEIRGRDDEAAQGPADARRGASSRAAGAAARSLEELSRLVETGGEGRLRDFLAALAVLSLPESPFHVAALRSLRKPEWGDLSGLEEAFLDPVPGQEGVRRPFSRQLARSLRGRLQEADPARYRLLNGAAARHYAAAAGEAPRGEAATRYLLHTFEARDWAALEDWLNEHSVPQALLHRIWEAASGELEEERLERVAEPLAKHYVRLGSYEHPNAAAAFDVLSVSHNARLRAWAGLKRAEGAALRGQFERAESFLAHADVRGEADSSLDATLKAELALVRASVARWRGGLGEAAALVEGEARTELPHIPTRADGGLVHAKVAVWAGLIAKDGGDLEGALREFGSVQTDDDLIRARVAFQTGDVRMGLGRFDGALTALSEAVRLAGEAPAFERARYLARRATLRRRRGASGEAEGDFAAALDVLSASLTGSTVTRDFERAKVEDERAMLLLAGGAFEEAALALSRNLEVFRAYGRTFEVDASFRLLRTRLRLGLLYWCRGLGQPYRFPLTAPVQRAAGHTDPVNADLAHARRLIRGVLEDIEAHPDGPERYGPLLRKGLLAASLVMSPNEGVARAKDSLQNARFPYPEAQSRAYLAAALLRTGDPDAALDETDRARAALERSREAPKGEQEAGDVSLLAWLASTKFRAHILTGTPAAAGECLVNALDNLLLTPYAEALLRAFGEAAETAPHGWECYGGLRERLALTDLESNLRLPDALVAWWRGLAEEAQD